MTPRLPLTALVQAKVAHHLRPAAVAVDATVGNGHDTLFLAQAVGPHGQIYGVDLQPPALQQTRRRLEAAGAAAQVCLIAGSHADLAQQIPPHLHGQVAVVMFNLGYLPGGDHQIVTRQESTLPALTAAAHLLAPGGLLSVVVYPGHPGGAEEAAAVAEWMGERPPAQWQISRYSPAPGRRPPPCWWWAERRP